MSDDHPNRVRVPGKRISGKRLIGGAAMLAIAAMLIFRDSGAGFNPSITGIASPETSPPEAPKNVNATPQDVPVLSPEDAAAVSSGVLSVLIDERRFFIRITEQPEPRYRSSDLTDLVQLARKTDGDGNGIRVQILRRETARPSAEQDLITALQSAGVSRDSIIMPEQIIP